METRRIANPYRSMMVCIDAYENQVPVGRFYTPNYQDEVDFQGVIDFIKKMESTLDQLSFAQGFASIRSFSKAPVMDYRSASDGNVRSGKVATLDVRILFRQNASWQGSVTWMEGKREEAFRSVLELLFLLDSAATVRGADR